MLKSRHSRSSLCSAWTSSRGAERGAARERHPGARSRSFIRARTSRPSLSASRFGRALRAGASGSLRPTTDVAYSCGPSARASKGQRLHGLVRVLRLTLLFAPRVRQRVPCSQGCFLHLPPPRPVNFILLRCDHYREAVLIRPYNSPPHQPRTTSHPHPVASIFKLCSHRLAPCQRSALLQTSSRMPSSSTPPRILVQPPSRTIQ
jgi:hypothetical protein